MVLAALNGFFYRMGGSGNFPRYFRGLGMVITLIGSMALLGLFHWSLLICAGALYGLSTTYFKKKGSDAYYWNWLLVGFAFSISILPFCIFNGHWLGFSIRTVVCTALVTLWSQFIGNAVIEEFGRGFICIATLPLLLIG